MLPRKTSLPSSQLTTTLAAEEQKLLACIHCGLCLEACPTYVLTGDENDSPRGRIYLMRAVEEGKLTSDSISFERHIDRCLGCRACEPVCPAGVEYGQLLEAGRSELFNLGGKRGLKDRLLRLVLRYIWLNPPRLKFAFAMARVLRDAGLARALLKLRIARIISRRFEFALALLESSKPQLLSNTNGNKISDKSTRPLAAPPGSRQPQGSALLFTGCVTEGLFARVNRATARVLKANNCTVHVPPDQVCCGALHAHAGDLEGARTLARKNIQAFADAQDAPIITNAGGCGAKLVTYDHLLANDESFAQLARRFSARVRDVSQQLETLSIKEGASILRGVVTYDASCHLLYGQHAGEASLQMLRAIKDLNFIPLDGCERCCGGAGLYNLLQPEMSQSVLKEKLAHVKEIEAETVATGNPGCQMQIGAGAQLAGIRLRVCHPVELLDESYERAGFYE
jgi:glycolate oxidase iron-sulfur subunit